jgi:hypothetical protein
MVKASFPEIDYVFWFKNYSWEGFSSMNGMISTMKNWKFISEDVTQYNITNIIQNKIEEYLKDQSNELLFDIFKLIQTWGGKSSGNHTRKMVENWNEINESFIFKSNAEKYKEFINQIINKNEISSFYNMTNKSIIKGIEKNKNYSIKIKGLSYSFVPKHICFWSGKGDRTKGFPILDDVIAKIIYKVEKAEKIDYKSFINDMNNFSGKLENDTNGKIKLSPTQIEMGIFAFTGNYWDTKKTATIDLKKKFRIESDDKKIAELIASQNNFTVKEKINTQKRNKRKKQTIIQVSKIDCIKNTAGKLFLSEKLINNNKKIKNRTNINYPIIIKNLKYFEYIGDTNIISILDND